MSSQLKVPGRPAQDTDPVGELVSSGVQGARPAPWTEAGDLLESAPLYWLTTVRPDGRPHATPVVAVWWDLALHFCVSPDSVKARNLRSNPHCLVTAGRNDMHDGLDLAAEGTAHRLRDHATVRRLVRVFTAKYGEWPFEAGQHGGEAVVVKKQSGHRSVVFRVRPTVVHGFRKGGEWTQTRWRLPAPTPPAPGTPAPAATVRNTR
ncbi:pyridoxamine 5'-phosphate oxidase family protein [Streptomyces sp. RFCAC02]|uniref:pyridoxamine 5'-phosphate oxidase family protein n=1 Tax=Streptomyces sp. RFCAC02 TaxID=2499143 RepID=UPI001020AA8A|nr:pyridoxamine 5'-phosphate oxidase family protein [Streptomyces sp. RFCAC02]